MVWVPVLRGRPVETAAQYEADTFSDPRTVEYVDVEGTLSKAYSIVLSFPPSIPAWDVYFVFGPEAQWPEGQGSKPPAPSYWMHQLGRVAPPEWRFDPEKLNFYVGGMLLKMGK